MLGNEPVKTGGKLVTVKIKDELEKSPKSSVRIIVMLVWPTREYWVGANFIISVEIETNEEIDEG